MNRDVVALHYRSRAKTHLGKNTEDLFHSHDASSFGIDRKDTLGNRIIIDVYAMRIVPVASYFFFFGFSYAGWVSRLPDIQIGAGISDGQLGIALFVSAVGSFLTLFLAPTVIGRLTSRLSALICSLVYAALVLLIPSVSAFPSLCAVMALMGMSAAVLDIAINTQAVSAENSCGRPIMSTFHGMFSLGAAVAGLLATRLSLLPLHIHMLCVGGLAIIASLSAANGLAEQDSATSSHDSQSGRFLPSPSLRIIAVVLFCAFLVEGALAEWSTKFMREEVKASLSLAPLGLAGFSLGMLVGRFVGDRFRQRFSAPRLVLCGSLLSGLASLLALVVPLPLAVSFLLLCSGLGLSILAPVAFSAAAAGNPSVRTEVALSQLTSAGYTAFMLGPALIGALSDRFGLRYALFLLPGLMGVSALLGVWAGKRPHAISIDRIT